MSWFSNNALSHLNEAAIIVVGGIPDSLTGSFSHSSDWVVLNPQPLPPEPPDLSAGITNLLGDSLDWIALNPQPLPPEPPDFSAGMTSLLNDPFTAVALNPQPLPPSAVAWLR